MKSNCGMITQTSTFLYEALNLDNQQVKKKIKVARKENTSLIIKIKTHMQGVVDSSFCSEAIRS